MLMVFTGSFCFAHPVGEEEYKILVSLVAGALKKQKMSVLEWEKQLF